MTSFRCAHLALGFGALLPAALGLDWGKRTLEIPAAPLQEEVEVTFAFANSGAKPVTILDIKTNCDCLEAAADRKTYQPGERGTLKALFTVGDRLGIYERSITVTTDEGGEPVRLAVRVDVPAAAEVTPRTVEWKSGDPAAARTIELVVAPEISIKFTQAAATSPEFVATLEPVEAGRRYRVIITPQSTATPTSAAVRLRGKDKSGREVVVSAYAYVR